MVDHLAEVAQVDGLAAEGAHADVLRVVRGVAIFWFANDALAGVID